MGKLGYRCMVCLLLMIIGGSLQAQTYDKLWKEVEQAQKKSLPQTVIKLTTEIQKKAEREKNAGQLLKAVVYRNDAQEAVTPDSLLLHIQQMEQWAAGETDVIEKAIVHSLLAEEYADYYRKHQGAILQRTELSAGELPSDMREWTYALFAGKVDEHAQASILATSELLRTSARSYLPFTVLKEGSRYYKHNMYHLLASRAIASYEELQTKADTLATMRIREVYEKQIDTYRKQADMEDAVLLCSLDYLTWSRVDSLSIFDSLIQQYQHRELCAEVYLKKASLQSQKKWVSQALQTCGEALRCYPAYRRINALKELREQLERSVLVVRIPELFYPGDSLPLSVKYSNLTNFSVKLYRTDFTEYPELTDGLDKSFFDRHTRWLQTTDFTLKPLPKKGLPEEEWPYQTNDTLFHLSVPDEPGVYVVQAVTDGKDMISQNFFVSSRLKVLTLSLPNGEAEVLTLDAKSGHPIPGVTVDFFSAEEGGGKRLLTSVVTDTVGRATVKWQKEIRSYVARKGKDAAMPPRNIYLRSVGVRAESSPQVRASLLTDRSLYRPGQMIHVKGIVYEQQADSAHVLVGKNYQLRLLDANRQEVSRQEVRTNDFGSFVAHLQLPDACLNGNFCIELLSLTSTYIKVEEYKRSSFEVKFQPVMDAYTLGDTLQLVGQVQALAGVALQDVSLSYTISRYRDNWTRTKYGASHLAADTLYPQADGRFTIPLPLLPGSDKEKKVYVYKVEIVATNGAGETQTSTLQLDASDKPYRFSASLPEVVCKEALPKVLLQIRNAAHQLLPLQGFYRLYPILDAGNNRSAEVPVCEGTFVSGEEEVFTEWKELPSGRYRLVFGIKDGEGREASNIVEQSENFLLFSEHDKPLPIEKPIFTYILNKKFGEQQPAVFCFGTSMKDAYVWMDVFGSKGRIESRSLLLNDTLMRFEIPYKECYGEETGLSVNFTFVKEGEVYTDFVFLEKVRSNRTLTMKWSTFRDRLQPGQEEQWSLIVQGSDTLPTSAEVLAMMYDASLDKIYHRRQGLGLYYPPYYPGFAWQGISVNPRYLFLSSQRKKWKVQQLAFDHFYKPQTAVAEPMVRGIIAQENGIPSKLFYKSAAVTEIRESVVFDEEIASSEAKDEQQNLSLRTNFNETAFFYPQLRTNEKGEVVFSFTMPESLTRWNFQSFAHTRDMKIGRLDASVVTVKEFMLMPNMPRFLRVGDKTQIAATIANLTDKAVKGVVVMTLFDPLTEKTILTRKKNFSNKAGEQSAVSFSFEVSDKYDLLGVRLVADAGTFSDGEQHLLPVLSNRVQLTEAVPMTVRGNETRTYSLDTLFNGNSSKATDRRLTVEMSAAPAWYAVLALPSLSNPTVDNAISWATSYYANSLAGFIANRQPRIKRVLDSWKLQSGDKKSFQSQLEKNAELKNILLAESPWVLEATTEREQRERLMTLFDVNGQRNRLLSALTKLQGLQDVEGSWSWFKEMVGSRYVTTYVTTLLLRLTLLTREPMPEVLKEMLSNSLNYLHKEAWKSYRTQLNSKQSEDGNRLLSSAELDYLYIVALSGRQVPDTYRKAYNYYLSRIGMELNSSSLQRKAKAAIVLLRLKRVQDAAEFIASLKEHLVHSDELGAYFAFQSEPLQWGMQAVSTHVLVMEALRMAGGNKALLEEMKIWLLKQKQVTDWETPIASADAVYALLQGGNLLNDESDVQITLGKKVIETLPSENKQSTPGLGYVKETFVTPSEVLRAKQVVVENRSGGMAWGAVYAQYLSPMDDVRSRGDALRVEKQLFVEQVTAEGRKSLQPIADTKLKVGDKVVARLVLTLDRAMDFVQLKESYGACLEPDKNLSGYRWNGEMGYYVDVKDATTNFFFDHLDKGVYVLEQAYRVSRVGTYQVGPATLLCAYAPEFVAVSSGSSLEITPTEK
ncbi:MAG: alpha-2-macroglobulin [Bacteroides sp.]|nr:alpha-2-macroglobulin [Bacteroides sp.]